MPDPVASSPEAMDRRSFVRTAGGAVGAGAVLSTPFWLSPPKPFRSQFLYYGAKVLGGPVRVGVPLIPVRVNADGTLEGVPRLRASKLSHSLEWYRYCNRGAAPGLDPDFTSDNTFRYEQSPVKMAVAEREGITVWYKELLGRVVRADDFTEPGMGAPVRWRSEGQEQSNIIPALVIRLDPALVRSEYPPGFADDGFLAACSLCTHFCCTAGFHESKLPRAKGLFEAIYCTCHDAVFDPYRVAIYEGPPHYPANGRIADPNVAATAGTLASR